VTTAVAALEVEGVGGLSGNLGSDLAEIISGRKSLSRGVRVAVNEESITVDLSILVKYGSSVQEVAKAVQNSVATAIENTSGFHLEAVNVHVSGVAFEHPKKQPKQG